MLKKDKPMLSVDEIIQSQGSKIGWDRPFSGNELKKKKTKKNWSSINLPIAFA